MRKIVDERLAGHALARLHATLLRTGLDLAPPTGVEMTPRGGSNLTCFVSFGDEQLVLRMPPPGAGSENRDLVREAQVLRRLSGQGLPVPTVVHICEDPSILGSPFVVTERVSGVPLLIDTPLAPDEVGAAERSLVENLAAIHALDPSVAFDRVRAPKAYLHRQIEIWTGQLERLGDEGAPLLWTAGWLRGRLPDRGRAAVVHGDYGVHNVLFADAPSRAVTAVLDWELATVGDPCADLAWFLVHAMRVEPDPPDDANHLDTRPGRRSVDALLGDYVSAGGREPDGKDLPFYEVLARWRLAVILLGLARNAEAAGDRALAEHHRQRCARQATLAADVIEGAPPLLAG